MQKGILIKRTALIESYWVIINLIVEGLNESYKTRTPRWLKHLYRHFSYQGRDGFLEALSNTLINKSHASDPVEENI